jgi:Sortase domain
LPGRHHGSNSHLGLWCTALALCLLVVGAYFRLHADDSNPMTAARSGPPSQPSSTVATAATPSATSPFGVAPRSRPAKAANVSPPIHLTVPSIGVSTALQRLTLARDGSLQAPTKWEVAGWYAGGIVPGEVGPAVIAGHIDSTRGPAVFYRLHELRAGATISVTEQNGTVLSFAVDTVRDYPKNKFPAKVVYGPTPTPVLRLISCTGEFDRSAGRYLSNVVVSAHLV